MGACRMRAYLPNALRIKTSSPASIERWEWPLLPKIPSDISTVHHTLFVTEQSSSRTSQLRQLRQLRQLLHVFFLKKFDKSNSFDRQLCNTIFMYVYIYWTNSQHLGPPVGALVELAPIEQPPKAGTPTERDNYGLNVQCELRPG